MTDKLKPKDFIFMTQRQRISPFPNYMSMESVCQEMEKYTGERLLEMIYFLEGNLIFGFPQRKSRSKIGKALVEEINKNPLFPANLVALQKKFGKELVDFTKKVNKIVSSKISDKDLYQMFVNYEKKYKLVYATYGWVWMTEDEFASHLLKIIEKKIKAKSRKAIDILNVLTKEPLAMVAMIERKALLELALEVLKQNKWKLLLLSEKIERIKQNNKLKQLINKHVKNYFWVTRDYEDLVITFEDVCKRLAKLLKKNVAKEYKKLIGQLAENEKLREEYLTELNFTKKEKKLFAAMRDIAYLKELRKTHVSQSLYYFDKVLEEIGKRLYLSLRQVRFMKTSDIKAALLGGKDLSSKLNKRIKLSLWWTTKEGTKVITGKKAEKLFNLFCKIDKNKKEFFGLPVSPGVARGPVKIVMNPNECYKVKKGDIIVTVQVVPSFSTAIMKSAGMICDGGHGFTSHPATLAREAGIPCVIQTRFARKVLKDGDLVEVDGYKGVAKKLRKK